MTVRRAHAVVAAAATTVAVLMAAAAADRWVAHGLEVTWRASVEGEIVEVDRTVEHRVAFPNEHRALARYVQAWDFDRWGVPDQFPDLDARMRGTLTVPEGVPRLLFARSDNQVDILVDGHRLEGPIEPGEHDLTIYWHGPVQPPGSTHWTHALPTSLELSWGPDEESLAVVPASAFDPPADVLNADRLALWIAATVLAIWLALLVLWALSARTGGSLRRRVAVIATALLLLGGAGLRLFDYDVMPQFRENMDELFATWNGWQLLEDGSTRGWTLWPARYVGVVEDIVRVEYFRKRPIAVVSPYFEHPPLLHVMVGAAAHLGGATDYLHARLEHTRLVPIGLGVLTLWLVVLLGRRLFPGSAVPWLAGLLYATVPHLVLMNRVIKEEALLTPLAMAALLFFLRWRDDGERRADLVAAAVLAGLCTLAKVPGLVFVVVLAVLVAHHGRWRQAVVAAAVGLAASSLLLVYAAAIDWNLFWYVTTDQATIRGSVWHQFVPFFSETLINHNRVGAAWLLFLWIGFAASVLTGRERRDMAVLTVPVVGYLVAIGLGSGGWHYGWYLLPVQPLLCLGAGKLLADLWDRPELFRGALFVLLPLMYGVAFLVDLEYVRSPLHGDRVRRSIQLFVVLFLAPYGLAMLFRHRAAQTLARLTTALGLALMVFLHASFVLRYERLYESHRNLDDEQLCDRCEE